MSGTRFPARPVLSLFPFFSFPDVLCVPTDLIWRKETPFEATTVCIAPSSEVFLGCKANARRSVRSHQDHFIITLIISDRRDWRDTRGKWPLARNPCKSWWHRHTNLKTKQSQCVHYWVFTQNNYIYYSPYQEVAGSIPDSSNFKCGLDLERGPSSLVRTNGLLLDSEIADLNKKVDINRLGGTYANHIKPS